VVAEMRHETGRRLEGAGIELSWPISDIDADETSLPYRIYKNWGSTHRELISNVIKHAGAAHVAVTLSRQGSAITLTVADDGKGLADRGIGNGLSNIEKRMAELGGEVTYPDAERGCEVRITIPLSSQALPDLQPSGVHV